MQRACQNANFDTPAFWVFRSIVALLVFNAAQEHHARGVVALWGITF